MAATKRSKPDVSDVKAILDRRPANIHAAMVRIQGQLDPIKRDSSNPHFKSSYASLDTILAGVLPVLTAHGCYLSSELLHDGEGAGWLVSKVVHGESETSIESRWRMQSLAATAQQVGSELTYSRRYLLSALLSLATGEDDDGEAAKPVQKVAPDKSRATISKPATSAQVTCVSTLFRTCGYTDEQRRTAIQKTSAGRTTKPAGLTAAEASRIITRLEELASNESMTP